MRWFGGDRIAKFWKWFVANEERLYRELDPESGKMQNAVNEVTDRLRKISDDLGTEFYHNEGKMTFFISAGGISSAIPVVESVHSKAPELARWNFVKFKQRKPMTNIRVKFADQQISAEDVRYRLNDEDDRIGIELLFQNYEPKYKSIYGNIGFILLDAGLGEYDVMTKVGSIQFLPMESEEDKACPAVINLANEFDIRYAAKASAGVGGRVGN